MESNAFVTDYEVEDGTDVPNTFGEHENSHWSGDGDGFEDDYDGENDGDEELEADVGDDADDAHAHKSYRGLDEDGDEDWYDGEGEAGDNVLVIGQSEASAEVDRMARHFLSNVMLRVNNVPAGATVLPPAHIANIMAMSRRQLDKDHVSIVVTCHALFVTMLRKAHCWANHSNIMFTRQGELSLNGGQSEQEHAMNVAQHALFSRVSGSPFYQPHDLRRRDISMSFSLPYAIDIHGLVNNNRDPLTGALRSNWRLDPDIFAGAVGCPTGCERSRGNASVTWYGSGKCLLTGSVTKDEASELVVQAIEDVKPHLLGVSLTKLRECIAMQKSAIIFQCGESGASSRRFVLGKNRVALFAPNPELPGNHMPVPTLPALDAAKHAVSRLSPQLLELQSDDKAAAVERYRRSAQLLRMQRTGMTGVPRSRNRQRGIGRVKKMVSASSLAALVAAQRTKRKLKIGGGASATATVPPPKVPSRPRNGRGIKRTGDVSSLMLSVQRLRQHDL